MCGLVPMGGEQSIVRNVDKRTSRREHRGVFEAAILRFRAGPFSAPSPPEPETGSSASSRSVRVCVRKRPFFAHEREQGEFDVISCLTQRVVVHDARMKPDMRHMFMNHVDFVFDEVFGDETGNADVYLATARDLVRAVAQGTSSGTVMCYGQTGSGKTFTMSSIYERVASDMFALVGERSVTACFVELLGDACFDILNAGAPCGLSTGGDGSVHPYPCVEVPVGEPAELKALIDMAAKLRATAATGVHDGSSRSHACCRIFVQGDAGETCLTLVDLAGTEHRIDSAEHNAERQKEGAKINASLAALKECIRATAAKAKFVPFRRNRLTQLLRGCFAGEHAQPTIIIATVSPSSKDTEHSLNTLRHACIMDGQGESKAGESTHLTGGVVTVEPLGEVDVTKIARERIAAKKKVVPPERSVGRPSPVHQAKQSNTTRRSALDRRCLTKLPPQLAEAIAIARASATNDRQRARLVAGSAFEGDEVEEVAADSWTEEVLPSRQCAIGDAHGDVSGGVAAPADDVAKPLLPAAGRVATSPLPLAQHVVGHQGEPKRQVESQGPPGSRATRIQRARPPGTNPLPENHPRPKAGSMRGFAAVGASSPRRIPLLEGRAKTMAQSSPTQGPTDRDLTPSRRRWGSRRDVSPSSGGRSATATQSTAIVASDPAVVAVAPAHRPCATWWQQPAPEGATAERGSEQQKAMALFRVFCSGGRGAREWRKNDLRLINTCVVPVLFGERARIDWAHPIAALDELERLVAKSPGEARQLAERARGPDPESEAESARTPRSLRAPSPGSPSAPERGGRSPRSLPGARPEPARRDGTPRRWGRGEGVAVPAWAASLGPEAKALGTLAAPPERQERSSLSARSLREPRSERQSPGREDYEKALELFRLFCCGGREACEWQQSDLRLIDRCILPEVFGGARIDWGRPGVALEELQRLVFEHPMPPEFWLEAKGPPPGRASVPSLLPRSRSASLAPEPEREEERLAHLRRQVSNKDRGIKEWLSSLRAEMGQED